MRRWLLPAVLALVTASSAVAAVRPPGPDDRGDQAAPAARAPVLSPRRLPALLSQVVADARLRSALDQALSDPALGAGRDRSCLVVRHGRRPLFERRPAEGLIPASNLKVLTALAVLARLGPEERLVTEARAGTPLTAGGVVDGPLWLVGGGDPLLATADYAASFVNQPQLYTPLEGLADKVVASGVREVRGGVLGDESRYDTQRYVPTWRPTYATAAEVGPASALVVNDGFVAFGPRHEAAREPDAHAATLLTGLLQARGVVVPAPAGEGRAPQGAVTLAGISSPPVRELVGEMLRESDNLTAELLVKELGRRYADVGSTAAGVGVVRATLAQAGLPVADLAAVDGSGLDRSDRVSCALLMAGLEAGRKGPVWDGLPVAGRDGTLARRFVGNPAAGRLHAKTGALDGVAGLTGYLDVTGEDPLAFSMLVNDLPRDSLGRALQERLGAILARYPEAPPPDTLEP